MPDYPYHPTLDVYRDSEGKAVTLTVEECSAVRTGDVSGITGEQAKAVLHALYVWREIKVKHEMCGLYDSEAGEWIRRPRQDALNVGNTANITKSCLLARLIYEGRPPMADPPPTRMSAPAYWLVDPALCPECGYERAAVRGSLRTTWDRETGLITRDYCSRDWHKDDHEKRCCDEHAHHVTPHVGCVLR